MLKTITMITKFILIALTVLLFASCSRSTWKQSREVDMLLRRTELYKFKSIEVSNAIDLIIEQSNKTEIILQLMIIYKKYHYNSKKWRTYYILWL
jgi:hypothetical protein